MLWCLFVCVCLCVFVVVLVKVNAVLVLTFVIRVSTANYVLLKPSTLYWLEKFY
jgi:hypothetical protein